MTGNSSLLKVRILTPLVVIAAGLFAYHNSFTGAFVDDDFGSIPNNPTIRHLWPIWRLLLPLHSSGLSIEGRPLINLSLAISYALSGYNVWGYHALNLIVHILAGLTLLGIVRRTLLQPALRGRFGAVANELALIIAVIWTVHPLQTESVTYIIQRAESIMGLFYLLTLYCFIRGVDSTVGTRCPASDWLRGSAALPSTRWFALSVTACALGMASKEVMVTAPLMVLLYDRVFLSGSLRETWQRRWPLYVALAGTWILLGFVLVSAGNFAAASVNAQDIGLTWWQYLATEPAVILYYLRLSVWPSPLCMNHPWPIANSTMSILPPAVVVAILLGTSAWASRRNLVWGFVAAWFFLILAPSSSIIPLHDPMYEHRMYLSLAAVVSLVVLGLYSVAGRRSLIVFIAVAVGLGFVTWRRNQDYRSEIAVRADAVARFPNSSLPHYNLGVALRRAGRVQEAIDQYAQALRVNPEDAQARLNWGIILEQEGKIDEAIEHYERALRIMPDLAATHYFLGIALARLGRMPEAIGQYEEALRLRPDYAEAHNHLGIALARLGRMPEAIDHYEQALRITPDYTAARDNLGAALIQSGRFQDAIEQFDLVLRITPDDAEAHYNLGLVLEQTGRVPEAIGHYERAVQLKPDLAEGQYNLGVALARLGRVPEAIAHWERALQINPDYAEVHENLGVALMQAGRIQEAIGHYEEAIRLKPQYAVAHYNLGVALERSGRGGEAIAQYEQALQIKPDYAEVHNNLGSALARQGRMAEAVGHWEQALRINPNYARAYYNLGTALEQTGRTAEAMEQYEQALRISPGMTEARTRLSRLRTLQ